MTLYNNKVNMFNNNIDPSKNKVYVNPNFNRIQTNHSSNTGMHVNPKFTYLLSNVQPNLQNNSKIYVNPNFMKSRNAVVDMQPRSSSTDLQQISQIYNYVPLYANEQLRIERELLTVPPITKSRYCLVRQNVGKIPENIVVEKPKTTIQVNKYKSIALKDMKLNLNSAKDIQDVRNFNVTTKKCTSFSCEVSRSQFKINNKIKVSAPRKTQLVKTKLKKVKNNLKKNNIPCRMFKKFGKCIRVNCKFLHDKKHVSICRKFLKGLCLDKNCLLSHDLTTKKMPTCYFYLQGTCTKSDCPYLHVKLSEKAKVCSDFLKGYCEKGNECLQRHVDNHMKRKSKVISSRQQSSTLKRKFIKVKDKTIQQKREEVIQSAGNASVCEKERSKLDCRYYQEHKSDGNSTGSCEVIKPSRCKLGTLPSFIQL